MSWEPFPPPSTFEKGRRKEGYRRFASMVKRQPRTSLLELDDVRHRLRLFDQTYVGVRPIPVDRIVGSANRSSDFTRDFLPKGRELRQRWKNVERAFPEGDFPPIIVYQIEDSYFVVDGHHRVAIAKLRGMATIDAEITRLRARFKLPPNLDLGKVILAEQQRIFMEESGLDRARPEAGIEFSRPDGYVELLELVKVHGYHLVRERDEVLSIDEVAADWYDRVYLPTVRAIKKERLTDAFPRATKSDLFLWIYRRRRSLFPERGDVPLDEAVREASEEESRRLRVRARQTVSRLRDADSDA